jgi:hypothetical protein
MDSKETQLASLDEIGLKYAYDFGKGKLYTGGDKTSLGQGFTREYETLFERFRFERINLLELGVFHGKSLAMWSEYFDNGSIHGIDIDLKHYHANVPQLVKLGLNKDKVKVYQVCATFLVVSCDIA